ncbi:hypothetical protein FACS1894172_15630 [Spirochaetia bacterium]|nr:hypothetical protein FACS1894164_19550 [Spirochaetia bacterium]GHU34817.1 hypothetical protein FACS1894172_15630 [Spirochaetia bacterium]
MHYSNNPIDRHALISRHNPVYHAFQPDSPLSIGNGRFCFTADITGLQTFSGELFPLCTMAEWGWHSYPDIPPDSSGLKLTQFNTFGRMVAYPFDETGQEALFKNLRQNAHKFHLGAISFFRPDDYGDPDPAVFQPVQQKLDLWEGILYSEFMLSGHLVQVESFVHPVHDTVYVRIRSELVKNAQLGVRIIFPYASHKKSAADFFSPQKHKTEITGKNSRIFCIKRTIDSTIYSVHVAWGKGNSGSFNGNHSIQLVGTGDSDYLECSVRFAPVQIPAMAGFEFPAQEEYPESESFDEARNCCTAFWAEYWSRGGAVDFSGSVHNDSEELERRIVLSQYLTAIQSRGELPPAETGLTCNSWYGKFHLEMTYWHSGYYALWNRSEALIRILEYYKKILPAAKKLAASQGYRGARFPKMCDPTGYNTPSSIAPLLVWQQPHPILLTYLCYRAQPDPAFLREYREVIVECTEFMLDFLHWDEKTGRFVLGAPVIPAQERFDPRTVLNPTFEVEYFRYGFQLANTLLRLLGDSPRADFEKAAEKLATPAVRDGLYLAHEQCPETFTTAPFYTDHPSMLAMLGILPGTDIDRNIMEATLDKVLKDWDLNSLWGWDFPMLAMTAWRLGRYTDAFRLLLLENPKNTYLPNGHNMQTGSDALPLYLPGNGGLLIAIALIAAGCDGTDPVAVPGWVLRAEGIKKYI